jgi:hypothetical protein
MCDIKESNMIKLRTRTRQSQIRPKFWYKPNLDLRNPMVKLDFGFDQVLQCNLCKNPN